MTQPPVETGLVPIGSIAQAPLELPKAEPVDPREDPFTGKDGKLDQHLGRIGAFIGGGPEKAGNIASIVIICSFILLVMGIAGSYWADGTKLAPVLDKLVTGCVSLITGAMGYLFGASKDSK